MGGEPTFVSIDDRDGAEWNTDALGPTKRLYAQHLVHQAARRVRPRRLPALSARQVVPGEQLPRWALSIYWRGDGQPCWRDPTGSPTMRRPPTTPGDARALLHAGAGAPGPPTSTSARLRGHLVLPVARAPPAGQRRSLRLPSTTSWSACACAASSAPGLDSVVGYVLPPREVGTAWAGGPRWKTGPWFVRDERMYLIPGDSPMGYRCRWIPALGHQGDYPT